jgi:hypothetical protein
MPAEFTQGQTRVSLLYTARTRDLPGLASSFAALISMHQDYRGNSHHAGCDKAKWLNLVPQPTENKYIAKPNSYRRQNDNEKRTVHSENRVGQASACQLFVFLWCCQCNFQNRQAEACPTKA